MANTTVLGPDAIAQRLSRDLPDWTHDGKALKRVYKVQGFKSAMMAANAIAHVAEAAWHHPDIAISWGKVEVALWSHDAGGVTERDFALAQRIEDVVAWRPPAGSALEGAPDDPQHAYVLRA